MIYYLFTSLNYCSIGFKPSQEEVFVHYDHHKIL